ncbi:MAG: class I tRNA ligase family protein [Patescibacteria group bacterium]
MEQKPKEKSPIAQMEEEVLALWEREQTFEKILRVRKKGKKFVFYEGPPTANGLPHPGHVMGRAFKDLFLRYKTMRGYFVPRRAGWDTHGLPVEIETEKKLGLRSKADIEQYGVAAFNRACKASVWKYKDEWEKMTKRIGLWLDMSHPYITYDNRYIESLWWVLKRIFDKGLLAEDYKVLPFCVRCGTGLSSHELAQPGAYQTVTDPSVYVKFQIADKRFGENAYFLVWTTTPWTLPANVALAVNPALTYSEARKDGETLIVAKDRASVLGEGWNTTKEYKGNDLVGMGYRQLFDFVKPDKKAFFVVPGDFVLATDGSGIVHLAPAYGEDDMRAAREHNLPVLHPVQENGEFSKEIPWHGKFVKQADKDIITELSRRGLLFREEQYEHEYPFCWRCDTPLLYFARKGWFIKMSELRKKLIANNKTINWIPEHTKEGRFGEWLKETKDWAFSRDRYWGTPLPIWRCASCGKTEVVGSIAELGSRSQFRNRYFMMRHGEALSNKMQFADARGNPKNHLTEKGKEEVAAALARFQKKHKNTHADILIVSPLLRTQETAALVASFFKMPMECVLTDPLVGEIDLGDFDGGKIRELDGASFHSVAERFSTAFPGGESRNDVKKRMTRFIHGTERTYQGKNIFIVGHGDPLMMLEAAFLGLGDGEIMNRSKMRYIKKGEIRELPSAQLPLDDEGNLDLHKPYIDAVSFPCEKCGSTMRRVSEVCDVWFDSGAMPLAQAHFPFDQTRGDNFKTRLRKIDYPADFICEGVDQTRGWFYTLLAVATVLNLEAPYKNVVSLGHILDKHGKKMSKSKKNYMDPMDVADAYGIDALRWYFFIANPEGEPLRFDEKDLADWQRKSVMMLLNIYNFLGPHTAKKSAPRAVPPRSPNVLDAWILSRCAETTAAAGEHLDTYNALGSSRAIAVFLDDLSTWYVRRSRERFQQRATAADRRHAAATLGYVFEQLLLLAAPFMPFVTEHLWRKLGKKGSIHAQAYPKSSAARCDKRLVYDMMTVRDVVSKALKLRADASIKVRQPLATLTIKDQSASWRTKIKNNRQLLDLVKEEVNVKQVVFDSALAEEVRIDTTITPELKEEGMVREIIRHIQALRKERGLTPRDTVSIRYAGGSVADVAERNTRTIAARVTARTFVRVEQKAVLSNPHAVSCDGEELFVSIA